MTKIDISKSRLISILSESLPSCGCITAANDLSDLAQIECLVTMTVREWKQLSPMTYEANKRG